ncbi:MAG: hypothetical protein U0175_08770 [Caldilineaceae bacterium]
MMADINTLRTNVYTLRLQVNQVQDLVNATTDPTELDKLLKELTPLQEKLLAAEQELSAYGQDTTRGTVISIEGGGGGPIVRGIKTTGFNALVKLKMTYVPTAIYHLLSKDEHPLLECKVKNGKQTTIRVRVTSYIEGYTAKAVNTIEVEKASEVVINQLPTLFPREIRPVTELTRATLNVLVEDIDNNKVETNTTEPIWLLSVNSAPIEVTDPSTGAITDLSRYLGAFVTPNAPVIMKYLRIAAKRHPEGRLYGYQRDVLPQVKAIFDALKQESQITYINSIVTFNPEENAKTQRVRLPRECLDEGAANCIDGTLLFASLLEAASLNPAIVIVPGHAFVGWQTKEDGDEWSYLETTMIGTNTFEEAVDIGTRKAKSFSAVAVKNPSAFRRWSLRELRTKYQITPLE